MKKLLSILAFLFLCYTANAQLLSTGLIDPARVTDWTGVGVTGGIPSAGWTKCADVAAYNGTAAAINTQLAGCAANTYVLLGNGTFNLTSPILITNKSNVVLRGGGANKTFLVFAAGSTNSCTGVYSTTVCINGSHGAYWVSDAKYADWTGGLPAGSSVLTLSNVTGLVANVSLILVDQCSDGNSGFPCSSNEEVDNLGWFNCDQLYNAATGHGCGGNPPNGGNQRTNRPQAEVFKVTNVNSGTCPACLVTISGSIRAPNYDAAMTPAVAVALNPAINVGIENLSIDNSAVTSQADCVAMAYTVDSWVRGVRCVNPGKYAFAWLFGAHGTLQDSYSFRSVRGAQSDTALFGGSALSDMLVQNNIVQWMEYLTFIEGSDSGSVFAYNFAINQWRGTSVLWGAYYNHGRDSFELIEGNVMDQYYGENIHGPKIMNTLFRNFLTGFESCANNNPCGGATFKGNGGFTSPIGFAGFSRLHNIIGNVLGTPGYHTNYFITTSLFSDGYIFDIGKSGPQPYDPIVRASTYIYGNVDAVTGFANPRWCGSAANTGWVARCGSVSEVPTGFSPYGQPLPTVGDVAAGQSVLPASLYLPASPKPSWFKSIPYPAIGPDVTGGNVGQCNGTYGIGVANVPGQYGGVAALNSGHCPGTSFNSAAFGGRANAIPAQACALNTMGMLVDGTNLAALTFNADDCYVSASVPNVILSTFPANFGSHTVGVASGTQTFTLTNSGTATLTYTGISIIGTNAADFSITGGTCNVGGSTLSAAASCTVIVVFTPSGTGIRSANLQVLSNATSSPDLGALSGTGQAAVTGTGANFSLTKMIWKNSKTGVLTVSACRSCGTNCFNCFKPGPMNPSPKIILW